MSREDPQFRLRLPAELKEKIEDAAKDNNRSLNAEIVFRLDASFLNELQPDELLSAEDALQLVGKAKEELSGIIFKRTFNEINQKVRIGHTVFHISLGDLELEGLNDDDFEMVFQKTFQRLKDLGYTLWDTWTVDGFTAEIPNKKPA
ncbi:TPA: Arc family DNA-binding protein [Serratia marcescens]|nr:Arc family DNA-binding protein [Serratia marcescens]HEJ8033578.1 Arc family DNA-binding protein [Serratia marcescens]